MLAARVLVCELLRFSVSPFFLLRPFTRKPAAFRPRRRVKTNSDRAIDLSDPLIVLRKHADLDPRTPVNGSSVPVSQLRIPSKAVKEVQRSQKAFEAGDIRGSADHLEKAVQIYPDFLQARSILGTRYVRLGEFDKALAEYQAALAIDPHAPQIYLNLCVALYFLGSYSEAELAARHSLEFQPQHLASRYMLGRALIAQGHATPEAMEMLRQSDRSRRAVPARRLPLVFNETKEAKKHRD